MEATPGFEPGIEALQAPALPLGDVAVCYYQDFIFYIVVPRAGIEPALQKRNGILSPARLPIPPPGHKWNWIFVFKFMERATRVELATPTLARLCSTTELRPHFIKLE